MHDLFKAVGMFPIKISYQKKILRILCNVDGGGQWVDDEDDGKG